MFAEELGLILETSSANQQKVVEAYQTSGAICQVIGHSQGAGQEARVIKQEFTHFLFSRQSSCIFKICHMDGKLIPHLKFYGGGGGV